MGHRPEPTAAGLLADLSDELRRTYEALRVLGVGGPSGGRTLDALAERVPGGRHELEYHLHVLEQRGLVGHEQVGPETVWYVHR